MRTKSDWAGNEEITGPEKLRAFYEAMDRKSYRAIAAGVDTEVSVVYCWAKRKTRPHPIFRLRLQEAYGIPAVSWASSGELVVAKAIVSSQLARAEEDTKSTNPWSPWQKRVKAQSAFQAVKAFLVLGVRPPASVVQRALIDPTKTDAELHDRKLIASTLLAAKVRSVKRLEKDTSFDASQAAYNVAEAELLRRGASKEEPFDGNFDFDL